MSPVELAQLKDALQQQVAAEVQARQQAEGQTIAERQRADLAEQKAKRLAQRLRDLGLDP